MSKQIRDLVHTIKSKDLTPAQIEAAFGEIYLSSDTIPNQLESQEIVTQVQIVKAPFYGVPIPNTTSIATKDGDSGVVAIITPESNKTYQLLGADATNGGTSSGISVSFGMYDGSNFTRLNDITVAAGAVGIFNTRNAFTFDSSCYPAILVTSGTASDLVVSMIYAEIVQ